MEQANRVSGSNSDTSRLSNASSQAASKRSQNFIEKNKTAVSRVKSRDPEGSADSSVVIKCLNEVDNGKRTSTKTTVKVKTTETTVLSSSRSSTSSLTSQKTVKRQDTATTASVQLKSADAATTTPLELEISIISNHSSIAPAKAPSPRPEVNKQQIRDFLHELNRMHEEGPSDPAPSLNSQSSPVQVNREPSPSVHNQSLQQGEQRCYNINNLSGQDYDDDHEDDQDDDLYISQSNQDKHKVRSLIAGRFSKPGPTVKRQIIPNFMQETLESPAEEDDGVPRERLEFRNSHHLFKATAPELPVVKPNFHAKPQVTTILHDHYQPSDAASSLVAMATANAVAQPFIKMQSEIEMKMSDVLNKLDSLRKSDDHLSHQLAEKKRLERMQAEQDWLDAEPPRPSSRLTQDDGHESKLKYYEQLQEKQFALMSQLISVIGKENRKAARTVEDTKANVRTIKRQFKISEPAVNEPLDLEQYSSQHIYNRETARRAKSKKSVSPFSAVKTSKSRSRSRNRSSSNPPKRKPRRNKSSTSSRSQSRSRTGSPFKRSLSPLTTRGLSRSRSNSRDPKKGRKKGQFLQDLLDQNKSPNGSMLGPRTSARSLSGKKRMDESYFDDRPTLFDKYLVSYLTSLHPADQRACC